MTPTRPQEFTGRHMWFVVIGFFGVIIAVNVGMAVVASTSWTGLVVPNSYVASQEFEEKRNAHEAQKAAGWESTFVYSEGLAKVVVSDGAGRPLDLGGVALKVHRPVGGHDDQTALLERMPDGGYAAALKLSSGVWDVLIQAEETPLGPFELHQRFRVEGTDQ